MEQRQFGHAYSEQGQNVHETAPIWSCIQRTRTNCPWNSANWVKDTVNKDKWSMEQRQFGHGYIEQGQAVHGTAPIGSWIQ